jgi:hypothetical protein
MLTDPLTSTSQCEGVRDQHLNPADNFVRARSCRSGLPSEEATQVVVAATRATEAAKVTAVEAAPVAAAAAVEMEESSAYLEAGLSLHVKTRRGEAPGRTRQMWPNMHEIGPLLPPHEFSFDILSMTNGNSLISPSLIFFFTVFSTLAANLI